MSFSNSLVDFPVESLSTLRDKFKVEWPKHIIAYSLLDNLVKRYEKNSRSKDIIKVYSLNGDWESDATFIAILRESEILFATLDPLFQKLKVALKLINYDKIDKLMIFMCVKEACRSVVTDLIKEENLHVLFDDGTVMKFLKKEDAKKFEIEIPEKFELRSLSAENAAKINSVWPHRQPGSEIFIEYLIENNVNVGLYNESQELVAWCMRHDFGSLAVLHTDENYLRKGYAEIVTKAICKKTAEEDDVDVSTNIIPSNIKSMNLFKKLGFKEIDKNYWIGVGGRNENSTSSNISS